MILRCRPGAPFATTKATTCISIPKRTSATATAAGRAGTASRCTPKSLAWTTKQPTGSWWTRWKERFGRLHRRSKKAKLAPLALRHDVYYDLLDLLTLLDFHKNQLLKRGLSPERIQENRYRSMPASYSARKRIAVDLAKSPPLFI